MPYQEIVWASIVPSRDTKVTPTGTICFSALIDDKAYKQFLNPCEFANGSTLLS